MARLEPVARQPNMETERMEENDGQSGDSTETHYIHISADGAARKKNERPVTPRKRNDPTVDHFRRRTEDGAVVIYLSAVAESYVTQQPIAIQRTVYRCRRVVEQFFCRRSAE